MTHPVERSWQGFLVSSMQSLANADDTSDALRRFLGEICRHLSASHCAIVTGTDHGLIVLEESPSERSIDLDGIDSDGIWTGGDPVQDAVVYPCPGYLALVLQRPETGGLVPLALVMQGVGRLDATGVADLQASAALVRLAHAQLTGKQHGLMPVSPRPAGDADLPGGTGPESADREALRGAIDRLTAAQALSVEIINDLMGARHVELDAVVTSALARMGRFCGSDRTYLFRDTSETTISNTHEWCAPGIEPMIGLLQEQPREIAEPWYEAFSHDAHIYIADVGALDPEDDIRKVLEMQGIRSLLAVPLRHDGQIFGFVGYDAVRSYRSFLKGEIHLIRSVANVMATMLVQRDAQLRLATIRAEQDLQRRRLHSTLSVIPDILLELDSDLRITGFHANQSIERQLDLNALIGRSVAEDFPADITAIAAGIRNDLESREVAQGYTLAFPANGTTRHYSVAAARRPQDRSNIPPGYIAILRDVSEQHAQRREIERLSKIARNTTNLVITTDPDGGVEWVNPAFEERTGYKLSEIRGRKPGSFLQCPETDQATVRRIGAALRQQRPITCELLNATKTGEKYWISMAIQPIHDARGALQGFMSVQTDITINRLHAQELELALASEKAARAQLKSAVDIMQDALILFDADQKLVICNERYRALYPELADMLQPGFELRDILAEGVMKGVFGKAHDDKDAWLERQLAKARLKSSQNRLRSISGRWYHETQKATPDGGRICILTDVTEWKDAERRALADRARAMDASRDGIVLATADGRINYANTAAVEIFGRDTAEQMIGLDWLGLIFGGDESGAAAQANAALEAGGFWQGQSYLGLSGGEPVEIETSATRNADQSILCIFRDISEKRRDEIERERIREELTLARRREEIGHIAAGLTHDFNNVLSVVSGAASMIGEAGDLDMARSLAGRISEASEQASGLLRRMLSLGKSETRHELLDLRRPLRDAEALVRPGLRAPVSLSVDLPDQPVMTFADSTSVVQMVLNLIINSRDALTARPGGQAAGTIALSLGLAEPAELDRAFDVGETVTDTPYARIIVEDDGPGMDDAIRASIFDAYFSTKGDKGTGLGVPIVASAVLEHGGALALDTAPGKGARFTILWPIEPPGTGLSPTGTTASAQAWAGEGVLVYSSSPDGLAGLATLLEQAGALTLPCRTLTEVAEMLAEEASWDAVVLDLGGVSGIGAAQAALGTLRAEVPVVGVIDAAGQDMPEAHGRLWLCRGPVGRPGFLSDLHACKSAAAAGAAEALLSQS